MTLQYFIVFLKIFQLSTPKSTNKTSAKRKQADQARKTRSGANRGNFWGEKHCKSSIILPAFLVLSEQRVQYHGSSSCVKMSSKLFLEGETCTSFELWLAFGISKSSILVQADSVGPQTVKQLDEAKPTNPTHLESWQILSMETSPQAGRKQRNCGLILESPNESFADDFTRNICLASLPKSINQSLVLCYEPGRCAVGKLWHSCWSKQTDPWDHEGCDRISRIPLTQRHFFSIPVCWIQACFHNITTLAWIFTAVRNAIKTSHNPCKPCSHNLTKKNPEKKDQATGGAWLHSWNYHPLSCLAASCFNHGTDWKRFLASMNMRWFKDGRNPLGFLMRVSFSQGLVVPNHCLKFKA